MVTPLGFGSSSGLSQCVVFLGKTLYSHSTSLHPAVRVGINELNARNCEVTLHTIDWHTIQGGSRYTFSRLVL